jgi:hypothetical protein
MKEAITHDLNGAAQERAMLDVVVSRGMDVPNYFV